MIAALPTPPILQGLLMLVFSLTSAACSIGPQYLKSDPANYAHALGEAKKRQILSAIVGLRYADAPGFLTISQIIAAYTIDASSTAVVNSAPDPGGPRAGFTGMAGFSNHPTFTFVPTSGPDFVKAYVHPMQLSAFLPLVSTGIPIDLLFRMTLQSIAGLNNVAMLGGPTSTGSSDFFLLLGALRRLQLAGALTLRERTDGAATHLIIAFPDRTGHQPEAIDDDLNIARRLLNLSEDHHEFLVTEGPGNRPYGGSVIVEPRSLLAILMSLGAEVRVPAKDVRKGLTKPTVGLVGSETRPVIIVRSGPHAPGDSYASVAYAKSAFWVDDNDFDSKFALTLVGYLISIAEVTDRSNAPLVTIPAN